MIILAKPWVLLHIINVNESFILHSIEIKYSSNN